MENQQNTADETTALLGSTEKKLEINSLEDTPSADYEYRLHAASKASFLSKSEEIVRSGISMKLQKRLGLRHGYILQVGMILGSGLFISPGLIAQKCDSTAMLLMIWVAAGGIAMLGSLCYCELGTMIRVSGGNYANILHIYGDLPGFITALCTCFVIDPVSITAISLTFGTYIVKPFFPNEDEAVLPAKVAALVVLWCCVIVNCISVNWTNKLQSVFSFGQISAVLFLVSLGVWQLAVGHHQNFENSFSGTVIDSHFPVNLGTALFSALWSYDGWCQFSNVIEEMKNVERNMVLVALTAFPTVITCYVVVNISLLTRLTTSDMASSTAVGVTFVQQVLGTKWSYVTMILVGLASLGTLNGTIFACPRLTMAAAREGHMPEVLSLLHKKSQAPVPAILLIGVMATIYMIPDASNLNSLIQVFSQGNWLIYGLCIFGVVVLRIRCPLAERPFKIFIGVPIMMTLISIYLVAMPFFENWLRAMMIFVIIAIGIPLYFVAIHLRHKHPAWMTNCLIRIMDGLQNRAGMARCKVA